MEAYQKHGLVCLATVWDCECRCGQTLKSSCTCNTSHCSSCCIRYCQMCYLDCPLCVELDSWHCDFCEEPLSVAEDTCSKCHEVMYCDNCRGYAYESGDSFVCLRCC